MGYTLCIMPIFKIVWFLEYLVFLERFFAQKHSIVPVEWFAFAEAIAVARWVIFKNVPFLEYMVFFVAVFCTAQL